MASLALEERRPVTGRWRASWPPRVTYWRWWGAPRPHASASSVLEDRSAARGLRVVQGWPGGGGGGRRARCAGRERRRRRRGPAVPRLRGKSLPATRCVRPQVEAVVHSCFSICFSDGEKHVSVLASSCIVLSFEWIFFVFLIGRKKYSCLCRSIMVSSES